MVLKAYICNEVLEMEYRHFAVPVKAVSTAELLLRVEIKVRLSATSLVIVKGSDLLSQQHGSESIHLQ